MSLADRFHALFSGLERAHGVYRERGRGAGGKITGEASTIATPPTVQLWERHLSGRQGIGIIPIRDDENVLFAAIDIDKNDIDHAALQRRVTEMGLPLVVCASKSGGAHCYIFFTHPTRAEYVRSTLDEWAAALGFPGVEVFPKQNRLSSDRDVGNWINMPYYHGKRRAIVDGEWLEAEQFLELAGSMAVDEATLLQVHVPTPELLEGGPPCLQSLARYGFPRGSRNNSMFNLGVYAQLRWPDDWEERMDPLNSELLGDPLGHKELATIIKSLKKKEYFYTCDKPPMCNNCNKELCRQREFGVGGGGQEPPLLPSSIQKLLYRPPRWVICVEGTNVETDTRTLQDQRAYQRLLMEECNVYPPPAKPTVWRRHIHELLQRVEEVEVPYDASEYGQFRYYVEVFCTSRKRQARTAEELMLGKVWREHDRLYFRSPDLTKFIDSQRFRVTPRQMWSWLREMGAGHVQRGGLQCWFIKMPERAEAELPDVESEEGDF